MACICLWVGAQSHWLMWGWLLEFQGKNVFVQLWMASLLFVAANTFVLTNIIRNHGDCPVFQQLKAGKFKQNKRLQVCYFKLVLSFCQEFLSNFFPKKLSKTMWSIQHIFLPKIPKTFFFIYNLLYMCISIHMCVCVCEREREKYKFQKKCSQAKTCSLVLSP
ncbi:hypothetical protein Pfo_018790 [Paulownia fortunei]|nr:hypothetical protein Pfo_018790 [Paulownia fortunei]